MTIPRLTYYCDDARHIICEPYSIANLHIMAKRLGISRGWYHAGAMRRRRRRWAHYDMPVKRIEELTGRCTVITSRELVAIIKEAVCPILKS